MHDAYIYKVYNCHGSRAYDYKRSEILFWLDGVVWMRMWWFWSSLCKVIWSIELIFYHTLKLIQHNLIVLAYNFNIVILVLIIKELSIGVIFTYHFILVSTLYYHFITALTKY
jgi:hypothetical protein